MHTESFHLVTRTCESKKACFRISKVQKQAFSFITIFIDFLTPLLYPYLIMWKTSVLLLEKCYSQNP